MIEDSKRGAADTGRELSLVGFALSDCVVKLDPQSAKYLRAVHRTALELSIANRFGVDVGGFWLMNDQIEELRRFSEYYPPNEAVVVARAVEAYLKAQLPGLFDSRTEELSAAHLREEQQLRTLEPSLIGVPL